MSPIITLLLAGTIVSTALKASILLFGAKAYHERRQSAGAPGSAQGWLASLRTSFDHLTTRGQPATETQRLLVWLQTTLAVDDQLRPWLATLSATEAQALAQDVAAFCATYQLTLPKLVEPPFASFAELQAELDAVVLAYCRARRAAYEFQAAR